MQSGIGWLLDHVHALVHVMLLLENEKKDSRALWLWSALSADRETARYIVLGILT